MKRLLTAALLALSSTVFAATLNPIQLLNPAGSTAGQAIVSTGASTPPAWSKVAATALAAQAANTVVANVTASSASPTAVAIPSCSTTTSALQYTSGTGFTCLATSANTTGSVYTGQLLFSYPNATTTLGLTWQNNGSSRWIVQNDGTAETGSNAGSNLIFTARTDAGAFLSSPLVLNRGSGVVTISALGVTVAITPNQAAGIIGTTTNNNANTGSVGEYLTGTNTGVSMTTATPTVCASVSLTAGDWDVNGTVNYSPAGTTTVSSLYAGTSSTTAITTGNNGQFQVLVLPFQTGQQQLIVAPMMRWSLASTTTVNLIGYSVFGTSTMTCGGFIRARRVR